ncbi:MAG: hypothetical protein ACI4S0_06990 [Dorea sp.]
MKDKIAQIVRIVTVPPVLILVMLLILFGTLGERFALVDELIMAVIFLSLVPACAYPMAKLRKTTEEDSRETQRNMAFVLNLGGYLSALVAGEIMKCSEMLMCVLFSYLLAVLILTFLNKICKIRASGHACSCTLPYLFLSYWLKGVTVLICMILYGIEFWASVHLKRHTVSEFLAGSITALVVFGIAALYFGFY